MEKKNFNLSLTAKENQVVSNDESLEGKRETIAALIRYVESLGDLSVIAKRLMDLNSFLYEQYLQLLEANKQGHKAFIVELTEDFGTSLSLISDLSKWCIPVSHNTKGWITTLECGLPWPERVFEGDYLKKIFNELPLNILYLIANVKNCRSIQEQDLTEDVAKGLQYLNSLGLYLQEIGNVKKINQTL